MSIRPSQPHRCINCRTRFASMSNLVKHERHCKRPTCNCEGYHYKHRLGSPCCIAHPLCALNRAARAGADDGELMDIAAGMAFDGQLGSTGPECPF